MLVFFFFFQTGFLSVLTPISSNSVVAADLRRRLNQWETLDSVFILSHPHALSRPLQPSKLGPCKKAKLTLEAGVEDTVSLQPQVSDSRADTFNPPQCEVAAGTTELRPLQAHLLLSREEDSTAKKK